MIAVPAGRDAVCVLDVYRKELDDRESLRRVRAINSER